jgi:outer membrane immunogenic protein
MRAKRLLLATVSTIALAGSASAADMAVKGARGPTTFAPHYNWTGFYVGGSLGIASHTNDADISDPVLWEGYSSQVVRTTSIGFTGGGQVGYNWQFRNFVIGVEADISYLGGDSSSTIGWVDSGGTASITAKSNALATIRARFGLDFAGTLAYGTFGVGWVHADYNLFVNDLTGAVPKGGNFRSEKWTPAIVVGGGLEHMLTPHWSVKGEALFVKAESVSAQQTDFSYFDDPLRVRYTSEFWVARLGVNYKLWAR